MSEDLLLFEDFVLNRGAYELRRGDVVVPLQRIPLELLCLLVERHGLLVTREEILERVWGKGVFVDIENSINTAVRKVRRALCDNPEAPRFVATVPTKGYRFVAEIRAPKISRAEQFRARPSSVMVGRERELASLLAGLDDAASRRGRLFLISGEPGVGKTRLAHEVAVVARANGIALLVGHCSEDRDSVPYLPFVEILESLIDSAASPDALAAQLGDEAPELARLLPKLRNILPDLPPPADLSPVQARRHLFNSFCDFANRIASEQPTLMILEDLHWADDSTLSLLDHLTKRLSDVPLMVIGTYRDADMNFTRGLAKTLEYLLRGRLATRVRLKGLPRDEVAAMLKSLSGKSPPASMVSEIHAETEGNPFFVEELFRHLEEEDRLYDSSGQFRSELKIGELEAPPSVRLVVARRLARLSDLAQKTLATAATIGRFFSLELLEASSADTADSLLVCIEEAEKAGLVFSVAESPKVRFGFSHELIRQAVIASLSAARRQRLHLEVADAIERTFSHALEDHWGELAFHYNRSGNARKAVDYLRQAAAQAAQVAAHTQADAYIASALERLRDWPTGTERTKQEIALQLTLGRSLQATIGQGAPEAERAYARAYDLCREVEDAPQLFRVVSGLWSVYQVQARFQAARELGVQLLALAESIQHPLFLLGAHEALGTTLLWLGEFNPAREHLEQGSAFYDPQKRRPKSFRAVQDPGVDCLSFTAVALWHLGYADQALKKIDEAVALARRLAHPYTLAYAGVHAGVVQQMCRQVQAARESVEAATAICSKHGFPFFLGVGTVILGWTLAHRGKVDEGIAEILHGLDIYRTTGSGINGPQLLLLLAEA
jgi:DNA-binding winged helix-turn-helix (wHTH) protein